MKLGREYKKCIESINRKLEENKKIKYFQWDLKEKSKNHERFLLEIDSISDEVLNQTNFFSSNFNSLQNGISRTNCIFLKNLLKVLIVLIEQIYYNILLVKKYYQNNYIQWESLMNHH
jgi:hypothetical protein